MTLGAPFTPTQAAQVVTPGTAANSLVTISPCDSVLVYNSGTILVFAALATGRKLYATTPIIAGGVPIPPGQMVLLGALNPVGARQNANDLALDATTQVAI